MCYTAGVKGQGEASSRHKEASDRPQEGDTVRIADAKAVRGKRDEAAKKVSSADKDERQKIKPSSGVFSLGLALQLNKGGADA